MSVAQSYMQRPFGVLFVCEDNSRSSLIAEALFRGHGTPGFSVYSAGIAPADQADPYTLSALTMAGLGSDGLWPKDWAGFADPDRPLIDMVIMIGDGPAQLLPHAFPGNPDYLMWRMRGHGGQLPRHRGAWQDIQALRPRVDSLMDDLASMQDVSLAPTHAVPAE